MRIGAYWIGEQLKVVVSAGTNGSAVLRRCLSAVKMKSIALLYFLGVIGASPYQYQSCAPAHSPIHPFLSYHLRFAVRGGVDAGGSERATECDYGGADSPSDGVRSDGSYGFQPYRGLGNG